MLSACDATTDGRAAPSETEDKKREEDPAEVGFCSFVLHKFLFIGGWEGPAEGLPWTRQNIPLNALYRFGEGGCVWQLGFLVVVGPEPST